MDRGDPMPETQAYMKMRTRTRKAEELVKKAEDVLKKAKMKVKMAKKVLKKALKAELDHRLLDYSLFADHDDDDC